jgi:hypothetical protein
VEQSLTGSRILCAKPAAAPPRPGRQSKIAEEEGRAEDLFALVALRATGSPLIRRRESTRPPRARRAARLAHGYQSEVPGGNGAHLGEIIENRYSNRYSGAPPNRGKLKYVIHMRMWRNWQTRRI